MKPMVPIANPRWLENLKAKVDAMPEGPHPKDDKPIQCLECSDTGFQTDFDDRFRYYARYCCQCDLGRGLRQSVRVATHEKKRKKELKAASEQARRERTFDLGPDLPGGD